MTHLSTAIRFSDEQAMLLDSATAFCRERSPSSTVRKLMSTEHGFDRAVWDQIVQLGWLGIAVPEHHGGSGLTLGHTAVIAEPMGRHLLATPFASTQIFTQGLLSLGDHRLQAEWLPRICQGSIASVALFEDDGDWTLDQVHCHATLAGATATLHGEKTLVLDAAVADVLLVSLLLDGHFALALVPTASLPPGALQRETVVDETRRSCRLDLNGVQMPANALSTGIHALAALEAMRNAALLLASAEAAGGIAGVLDVIVEYLNTRTTFGRKIGSYQGLKHPSADILIGLERARSHVAHAATLLADEDDLGLDAEVALRMAKVEAGDSFVNAGDRAVQFHGGFGFTWDCNAQLYLRRALWLQPWFGDAAHHRRRLADKLWEVEGRGMG
jgi:alkylation response protein AidB-like acyl-CoA dehydrogenase